MKKLYFLLLFGLIIDFQIVFGQCEIVASALPDDIVCGSCVTLTAFGEGQGNSVFTESFNTGAPTGWQSTASATYTNPCDPAGVNGTPHLWMGDLTGVPRQMTTIAFDFSTATAGATICFDMLFAEQGDASPCEGPDEPDEGVYLEYSIDGGITWITINYFDPNGGNDASLINWNNWCFPIPVAALTASTQFRWFQDNDSGADYDHWGLDNVNIYFNDPTFNITWQHDNYSYGIGNGGGDNPTPVCPQETTTYTVTMTNGTSTCTDSVTVTVTDPDFRVTATPDTSLCLGQCADLIGEALVIVSPAKTPTYENSEVSTLTGLPSASDLANLLLPCVNLGGCTCPDGSSVPFLGQCPTIFNATLSMNINITDLNTTVLQNGELTSICIGDALMVTGDLTPFEVTLDCPSGTSIILANAGDLTGTTLNNTCFDLLSSTPVSAGVSPYSGTFQPVNPLSNLNGCSSNGVWTLNFTGTFDLASGTLPVGFLNGWDISFDDPEISYTGDFTWSPTTDMTASNTLSPNVCPTANQEYTLTVSDTAGCSSDSASVMVTVVNTNCCPFEISYTTSLPTCGNNDGSIDISIANGSGNYTYAWSNSLPATEDAINLGGGTYTITITDVGLGCQKDTTIVLAAPNAPVVDSVVTTATTCGLDNGEVVVFITGGIAPITFSIDGGTNIQVNNTFSGLAEGNYTVTVTEASGCDFDFNFQIDSSSAVVIVDTLLVLPTCGEDNGEIVFSSISGGVAPYQYSIDSGLNFGPDSLFVDLSPGNYTLVVLDDLGCADTALINLIADPNAPPINIDSILSQTPSCGASDGEISIFTNGPPATTVYSIDGGASFQPGSIFTGLTAATYDVVVMSNAGCQDSAVIILAPLNAPVIDSIVNLDPSCIGGDGAIEIFASGGVAPLTFSLDSGISFLSTNTFNNLNSGIYEVVVMGDDGCQTFQTVSLTSPAALSIDDLAIMPTSCGLNNGEIAVAVSGGSGLYEYSFDNGVSFQNPDSIVNLAAGTYTVVIQETGNPLCQVDSVITILQSTAPVIDTINVTNESCFGLNDGGVVVNVLGGQPPYSITLNGSNTLTNLSPGNYTVEVNDANNCVVSGTANVLAGSQLSLVTSNDTSIGIGESLVLNSQGSGSMNGVYTWSPSAGLSCIDCPNPTAVINGDITYLVNFMDTLTNCDVAEQINILAILEQSFCLFPDAFSPNNDLNNDVFRAICNDIHQIELKVYNRWGELIFKDFGPTSVVGWNGEVKNRKVPVDVYIYVANIEYLDGTVETKSGNFTVIR